MYGGFSGARWLFLAFAELEFLAELLIRKVLTIVLLLFSGLLVFSNTVTAFSTFYLADDLPLLMSSPVPVGRLYLARLVDTWAQSSWMVLVFALPIMAGCGPVLGVSWWFYLLLPLLVLPLTIVCAAAGTTLTMLLARWLPARRTHDVLLVLAVLAFLVLYVAFRLAEPEQFINPEGFDRLVSLIGELRAQRAPTTPADWVVLPLFHLLRGEYVDAILPLTVLFTAASASAAAGAWVARLVYSRSYGLAQEGRDAVGGWSRLRTRSAGDERGHRAPRFPRTAVDAMVQRDTRAFFRTTGQWTQLLLIAALVVVYVFNFKHFKALEATGIVGPTTLFFLNVLLGGFVITTIVVRFLYPAVSLEGRAFWVVRASPVRARDVLRAKVRWGLWPMLALSLVLALASNLLVGLSPAMLIASVIIAVLMTYALTGLAVGLGSADPQFHVDNPAKIASGIGGVLFMLIGLSYLVVVVAALAWPIHRLRLAIDVGHPLPTSRIAMYGGLAAAVVILSVLAHHVPLRIGARRLEERE